MEGMICHLTYRSYHTWWVHILCFFAADLSQLKCEAQESEFLPISFTAVFFRHIIGGQ